MNINISDFYNSIHTLPGSDPVANALSRISSLGKQPGDNTQTTQQATSPSYQVSLSASSKTHALFGTFRSALEGLNSPNKAAPFEASSSLPSIVSASVAQGSGASGRYDVSVSQLAEAQTLVTGTYANPDTSMVGTGRITIETGSYDATNNLFSTSGTAAKTIQLDATKGVSGTLNSLAKAINSADAGVKAEVESVDSGGYRLKITSADTGTEHTLRITVADADNSNSDTSGLSVLAYNPTAGAGSGKNLSESNAAQNAEFTVNLKSHTSQSNNVTTAVKDVTLQLKDTGAAAINVVRSFEAFHASSQKLVGAYNALLENSAEVVRKAAEAGVASRNPRAKETLDEIGKTLEQTSSGVGGQKLTLADIGITRQADGKLEIDPHTLERSFNRNADGAASLLSGVAQKLTGIVDRFAESGPKQAYTSARLFAPQPAGISGLTGQSTPYSLFDLGPPSGVYSFINSL